MRGGETDHNAQVGYAVEQDVHDWIFVHDSIQPRRVDHLHIPERDVDRAGDEEGETYGLEALSVTSVK